MADADNIAGNGLARKINILCLLAAIVLVLVLPLKKEIWYDETVSIKCSKGISHDTPAILSNIDATNSTDLARLNTASNVFSATVLDNGNSFLYNICLHWFTLLFGNSIAAYMLLSKLCAVATLIAFYVLSSLFLKNSLFTSVALIFLATDNDFAGMSHEIRAYAMGMFFVTIAAVYLYKFLYENDRPFYLLLTGLFSAGAILSHFLSLYIILVFLGVLLFTKRGKLFAGKNILAILVPVAILAVFFYFSYSGLQTMSHQNQQIQARNASLDFSIAEVLQRSIKFTAINFKAVFPAFGNRPLVSLASFLLIIILYIAGIMAAADSAEKRNLHLLLLLGGFGSLFLLLLSVTSHHYTALYYRYYSFCVPFCCLFITYLLYILFKSPKINSFIKGSVATLTLLPACLLFVLGLLSAKPRQSYNHVAIAGEIVHDKVAKAEVPGWEDALLIQCFLPSGYKIDYVRNPAAPYFTLYKTDTTEKIPVIKKDS